jgi:hypothetical protein
MFPICGRQAASCFTLAHVDHDAHWGLADHNILAIRASRLVPDALID